MQRIFKYGDSQNIITVTPYVYAFKMVQFFWLTYITAQISVSFIPFRIRNCDSIIDLYYC